MGRAAGTAGVVLTVALAAGTAPRDVRASPQDLFGYGARAMAMGATGAAFVDDFAAVHANPAGISRARARSITLGFLGAGYDLTVARGDGPAEHHSVERARGTLIGLTIPLPFGGALRDRVAIGFGFYTPTDVVVRGRILRPETPQFVVVADRAQSIALQAGLGFELPLGLRVGLGVTALAAVRGGVLIAMDGAGRVGSRVDNQLVADYAPIAGLAWDAGPLRLAAVYRHTSVGRFGVLVEARDIGLPLPQFNIAGIAQYDPRQVALEAAFARGAWLVAAGATYKLWSGYPGPLERTTEAGPPPPWTAFADTLVVRAGVEYARTHGAQRVAARLGAFYEPTPAPPAETLANYLDNDRLALTAGVAVSAPVRGSALALEVFGQVHVLARRTARKRGDVAADNPGAPSIAYGGAIYVLGLSASVGF